MIGRARFALTMLAFGYAFLYVPILLVMVYSFNESRLVTVWAGFSLKWWHALFENGAMLSAAWLSLRIAVISATCATILGLAAGYVLSRAPSFFGRTLFGSLVIAPMVMPEVVMGISMLLLFVGTDQLLGGPGRGFLTIAIAHTTFALSFVAIVLLPRQFHVTVVENNSESEIKRAVWLFPLYLVLINLFVIPIAMAGLLMDNSNQAINALPGIGELPILGTLFRSDSFVRNETELVIMVTPYIMRPVSDPAALKAPTDGIRPPSDLERILLLRQVAIGAPARLAQRLPGQAGFVLE